MWNICGSYEKKCNVYLYSRKPHLYQLFHSKVPDMISLGEIFVQKNKGKLICISPNDMSIRKF